MPKNTPKKIFIVRMNCIGFKDYHIKAKTKEDAINEAHRLFQCDNTEAEFGELLDKDSSMEHEHSEVQYKGEDY